jgi:hypothetical protein
LSLRPIDETDLTGFGDALDLDGADSDLEFEDWEPGWGDRIRALAGRGLIRLGWLALAAGLAFGSAGIVAAAQHSPATGARPELTWGQDEALATRLTAAVRDLARLSDDVDSLGTQARKTLSSLTQINQLSLQQAWNDGSNALNAIDAGAADLNGRLQCAAWDSTLEADLVKTYSPTMVDRYHKVCAAIGSVAPLHDDWQAMVAGSRTAIAVANDIESHDSIGADALQLATQGRYVEALRKLADAEAAIADATAVANHMALVKDVSTLTDWLTRTTDLDNALSVLWHTMIDSNGMVTAQVTAALRGVNDAKARLPVTNDVFGVVMYEMAGNLTSNGISIETAKGALASALADLNGGLVFGR